MKNLFSANKYFNGYMIEYEASNDIGNRSGIENYCLGKNGNSEFAKTIRININGRRYDVDVGGQAGQGAASTVNFVFLKFALNKELLKHAKTLMPKDSLDVEKLLRLSSKFKGIKYLKNKNYL